MDIPLDQRNPTANALQPPERPPEPATSEPADAENENPASGHHGQRAKELWWAILAVTLGFVTSVGLLAATSTKPRDENGAVDLFRGSCARMNSLVLGASVPLNLAATMILFTIAACLGAAANQGPGVPIKDRLEIANVEGRVKFGWTKGRRRWFVLLVLLSLPLHLFWNAVIFRAPGYSDFSLIQVLPSFLTGGPYPDDPLAFDGEPSQSSNMPDMESVNRLRETSESLVRLDTRTCSALVAAPYLSEWSNLVAVLDLEGDNNTIVKINQHLLAFPIRNVTPTHHLPVRDLSGQDPWFLTVPTCNGSRVPNYGWIVENIHNTSDLCAPDNTRAAVQYCLGEPIQNNICSIKSSPAILGVLLALHIAILGCLGVVWFTGLSPFNQRVGQFQNWFGLMLITEFILIGAVIGGVAAAEGRYGVIVARKNVKFGEVDPWYLTNLLPGLMEERRSSLLSTIVFGNVPQLAITLISLTYLSSFLSLRRDRISRGRKFPFLLLSIPVLISMLLHWSVSQAMFPVQFQWYTPNGLRRPDLDVINGGYCRRALDTAVGIDLGVMFLPPIIVMFSKIECFQKLGKSFLAVWPPIFLWIRARLRIL